MDKLYLYDWLMVALDTFDQSLRSKKSLHPKLGESLHEMAVSTHFNFFLSLFSRSLVDKLAR